MVTNLGRKLTAIFLTLGAAILALLWPGRPAIPLGLDLKGGSRLVYRLDIEQAQKEGKLTVAERQNPAEILESQRQIIQERVDKLGLRDIPILAQGTNEILIELPGMGKDEVDNIRRVIENLGELEFRIVADPRKGDNIDLPGEEKKRDDWLKANPTLNLRFFNILPEKEGGPREGYRWYPNAAEKAKDIIPYYLLRIEKEEKWNFQSKKQFLEYAIANQDPTEGLVVAFGVYDRYKADFTEFTKINVGRQMAIVLNGAVRSAPTINSELPGRGQITGNFSYQEVTALTNVLRTGSLAVKPELQSAISVGASLGQDAIDRAALATLITMILIPLFMIVYYGGQPFWFSSGVIASIAMLFGLFLILGAMSFFRATLTLPGIGGLILTAGMAVDANILIYERIREEREKGRSMMQAAFNGFDRAAATIIDCHITTLISGLILFWLGSGPIKGFAVTLAIGILTTLFATLVLSKVLFHIGLVKGWIKEIKYLKLMSNPSINFMKYKWLAVGASIVFIFLGVAAFFSTDDNTKYGLDFTGGAIVRVQMNRPVPIEEVRDKVNKLYPSASVNQNQTDRVSVVDFAKGISDEFTIKFKLSEDERKNIASGKVPTYIEDLRRDLQGYLLPDGTENLQIAPVESGKQTAAVTADFHLAKPSDEAAIKSALSLAPNLGNVQVEKSGEDGKLWKFKGVVPAEMNITSVRNEIVGAFVQSASKNPNAPALLNPFPERNQLGARAVMNLRDQAIRSLLLAFLGIILYVRFRFHEYRWGIGAVVAIIHDVAVALGAVVLVQKYGMVSAEIDLTMLAAFLTIIGYSVNDTIVIFDRIRENAEKSKESMEELMNQSINQTLSRTVLTAATVMLVVTIMFFCNYGRGNVLEGFSFAMMIGTVVGCYSSIYIAGPIVLLFVKRDQKNNKNSSGAVAPAKASVHK